MAKTKLQEAKFSEWERRIEAWRASGESKKGWCRDNKVSVHQLRVWLKRFDDGEDAVAEDQAMFPTIWASVTVDRDVVRSTPQPLVVRVGRAEVEVHRGFDAGLLADVVKALVSAC